MVCQTDVNYRVRSFKDEKVMFMFFPLITITSIGTNLSRVHIRFHHYNAVTRVFEFWRRMISDARALPLRGVG